MAEHIGKFLSQNIGGKEFYVVPLPDRLQQAVRRAAPELRQRGRRWCQELSATLPRAGRARTALTSA
jgi:hypothetical protein